MDTNALTQLMQGTVWAIHQPVLEGALARWRASGGQPAAALTEAQAAAHQPRRSGAVAVVPIYGVLRQKGPQDFFDMLFSGGTSMERLGATIRGLVANESIGTIVLDIDSPGGSVAGTPELADELFKLRGTKPIVAVVNPMAASSAYWVAAQADEVIVTPSGWAGSIGIIVTHTDLTAAAEQEGVKVSLITAGKHKGMEHPMNQLSDEQREIVQGQVDEHYAAFVAAVARGRGVKASAVRSGFGEGAMVLAREAVREGVADRVATLRDTLVRLAGPGARRGSSASASAEDGELEFEAITETPPARTEMWCPSCSEARVEVNLKQEGATFTPMCPTCDTALEASKAGAHKLPTLSPEDDLDLRQRRTRLSGLGAKR